jgi:hypothetical protein
MNDLDRTLHTFRYEVPRRAEACERRPEQRFDRLAFALEAVGLLRPRQTRVAVFPSSRLVVEEGRDLARGGRDERAGTAVHTGDNWRSQSQP